MTFDDLIISAGSAGCVLANRLSKDSLKGIGRLGVNAASAMPLIRCGATNAPAAMIAEKGADMMMAS